VSGSSSRLTVARDPALALIVRIFVGAVAERLEVPESSRDDLRLAASELFTAAVESGSPDDVSLAIERDGDVVTMSAGIDASADAGAGGGTRFDLVRALFPDAEVGRSVRISVPAGAGPTAT
jgi:hypothetical protein